MKSMPWFAILCTVCSFLGAASKDCNQAIGIGDKNVIKDQDFSASSTYRNNHPYNARLTSDDGKKSWCFNDAVPFIKVKLPNEYKISRIALQGRNSSGKGMYVKSFEFSSGLDGARFPYPMNLRGNTDKTGIIYQHFDIFPVVGDEVTISPKTWYPVKGGCLRFELYGCKVEPEVVPTTAPINHCQTNNGGCEHYCKSSSNGPVCSCKTGHRLNSDNNTCSDINECIEDNKCDPKTTFCHDITGSFICYCKNSSLINDPNNRFKCIDKDECDVNNGNCEQKCFNTPLGYRCGCNSGYVLNRDGRHCDDVDECKSETLASCDKKTSVCNNTEGSYECKCKPGYKNDQYNQYKCVDINECGQLNGHCSQICTNSIGSYNCSCYPGYELQSDGRSCQDINECIRDAPCDSKLSKCRNTLGSFRCQCFSGLKNDPNDKTKCININECATNNGNCDHYCHDTYRSHYCTCKPRFHLGQDGRTCKDDNECSVQNGGCQHHCINFDGGYRCDCNSGFRLNTTDYKSCIDIDECSRMNGGCSKYCNNTVGSYFCSCDEGYKVVGKICFDDDECSNGKHNCNKNTSTCINTHGSFLCQCKNGYTKDQTTGQCIGSTCSSLYAPSYGYVSPAQCSQDGNAIASRCYYKCNDGYKLSAQSATFAYCTTNGNWIKPDGSSPRCEPIRCPALSAISNGYLLPSECATVGGLYGKSCLMDCSSGYNYIGPRSVKCKADGTYDGDFSGSKCVEIPKLKCPSDKTVVLPIGKKTVRISIGKISTNVKDSQLQSEPNGALNGTYDFPVGIKVVKIIARNEANKQEECSFTVTVQDKEPPTVSNCDANNQYISIDGSTGLVTWKEPIFSDNVGIYRTSVNLKNGELRQPQVFFVDYSVRDKAGNTATCRFFVHVQAKYCDVNTMPGGYGGIKSSFSAGTTLFVSISCPSGKTFSQNFQDYYPWAKCFKSSATWSLSEVPSCVGFAPLATPCPAGTQRVKKYPSTAHVKEYVCANCRKGTFFSNDGSCEKCADGYYQDEEAKTSCKSCPAGSKTLFKGASSIIHCKALCESGSFSKDGLKPFAGCTKCPIGSYQSIDGQKSCMICPEGGQTNAEGAKHENECFFPARITKVVPESQEYVAVAGDNITIECTAVGSPRPHLSITNSTKLAPARFRGTSTITNLPSNSAYIVRKRLTITNAQIHDSGSYKCSATNQAGINGWKDERQIDLSVNPSPLAVPGN